MKEAASIIAVSAIVFLVLTLVGRTLSDIQLVLLLLAATAIGIIGCVVAAVFDRKPW